jgi:transcription initiation factor TFIID subunit 7
MNAPQESHFILRLPERLAKRLRDALESSREEQGEASGHPSLGREATVPDKDKATEPEHQVTVPSATGRTETENATRQLLASTDSEQFWLVFFPENRNGRLAALRIGKEDSYEEHFGFLFDLPCITESWKTLDGRTVYKCADVHQILQIYEDPRDLPLGTEESLPDGLTPASRGFAQRHRPEEPKYSAVEVAQHEEIIKYALDFRKPWGGPMPVSVDVDEDVIEEEIWVPAPRAEPQTSVSVRFPTEQASSLEPAKQHQERHAAEEPPAAAAMPDADQFASELEQALLLGSDTTPEAGSSVQVEQKPAKMEAAVRQAEQARRQVLRRNLEQRVAELEHEVSRITNPLLKSRVQRRLDQTREELNQLQQKQ